MVVTKMAWFSAGVCSLIALVLAVCMLAGCGGGAAPPPAGAGSELSIVVPTRVVNMARQSPDGVVEDLKSAGEGHYTSIEARGTEGVDHEVVITMPGSERQWWLDKTAGYVGDVAASFAGLGGSLGQDGYRIEVSDDFMREDFHYNLAADPETDVAPHLAACEYYCAMWQLLAGDGDGAYSITTTVYNCDTGKVVASATASSAGDGGDLKYDDSDWE